VDCYQLVQQVAESVVQVRSPKGVGGEVATAPHSHIISATKCGPVLGRSNNGIGMEVSNIKIILFYKFFFGSQKPLLVLINKKYY